MYTSTDVASFIDLYVTFVGNSLNNPENPIPCGEATEMRWWTQLNRLKSILLQVPLGQLVDAIAEFPVLPVVLEVVLQKQVGGKGARSSSLQMTLSFIHHLFDISAKYASFPKSFPSIKSFCNTTRNDAI